MGAHSTEQIIHRTGGAGIMDRWIGMVIGEQADQGKDNQKEEQNSDDFFSHGHYALDSKTIQLAINKPAAGLNLSNKGHDHGPTPNGKEKILP